MGRFPRECSMLQGWVQFLNILISRIYIYIFNDFFFWIWCDKWIGYDEIRVVWWEMVTLKDIYICYVYNINFSLFGEFVQGGRVSEMENWVYICTNYIHNINFFLLFLNMLVFQDDAKCEVGGDFCLWVLGRVYFCGILVVSSWFFSQWEDIFSVIVVFPWLWFLGYL